MLFHAVSTVCSNAIMLQWYCVNSNPASPFTDPSGQLDSLGIRLTETKVSQSILLFYSFNLMVNLFVWVKVLVFMDQPQDDINRLMASPLSLRWRVKIKHKYFTEADIHHSLYKEFPKETFNLSVSIWSNKPSISCNKRICSTCMRRLRTTFTLETSW